jgi:hypothetical protein
LNVPPPGSTRRPARRSTGVVLTAVVVAALVASACSSSGSKPTAASSSTTTTRRVTTTTRTATGGAVSSTTPSVTSLNPPTTQAPAAGTASKAAFLTEANSICKQTNAKTKAVGDEVPSNPTGTDQADALDHSANLIAAGIEQMRNLDQPGGDRTQLILFYQRSQQLITLTHQLAAAFRRNDANAITAVETKALSLDDDLTKAADAYGLSACGSGPTN